MKACETCVSRVARGEGPRRERAPRSWSFVVTALASAPAVLACTAFEPGTDTLPEGETAALEVPGSDAWRCLSPASPPSQSPVSSQAVNRVVISVQIVDLTNGQLYPGATLRACGLSDINCLSPVVDALQVDERGWIDVPLFEGFQGFFEVTGDAFVPFMFYLTEPVPAEPRTEFPFGVVSQAGFQALVNLAGLPFQPETGLIAFRAFDCTGATASGVTFTSDSDAVPWFFVDGLPNIMVSSTSSDGIFGLGNATPGLAVIDAHSPEGLSIVGPQSVVVRAGWMSTAFLRPRRAPGLIE